MLNAFEDALASLLQIELCKSKALLATATIQDSKYSFTLSYKQI